MILKNDSTPDGGDIEDDADVCFGLPTRILYDLSIQRMHQLNSKIESLTQVREDNMDRIKKLKIIDLLVLVLKTIRCAI